MKGDLAIDQGIDSEPGTILSELSGDHSSSGITKCIIAGNRKTSEVHVLHESDLDRTGSSRSIVQRFDFDENDWSGDI